MKIPKKLPIIFHNLKGYDDHLIFKELNNFNVDIQVIPNTSEKYMTTIVNRNIVLLDSNQFYKGSLGSHAPNLEKSELKNLLSQFSINKLEILKRKDAYPYVWVDSYDKFNYQELRPRECFYSLLNNGKRDQSNGHISAEEYLHLQNVWKEFNFNTFKDFDNQYLKKDVLLLIHI